MQLRYITVENVLSFGSSQRLGFFGPVAALIGHNNAGKSNVFKALNFMLRWHGQRNMPANAELEKLWHAGDTSRRAKVTVEIASRREEWSEIALSSGLDYRRALTLGVTFNPTPGGGASVIPWQPQPEKAKNPSEVYVGLASRVLALAPQLQLFDDLPQQHQLNPGTRWTGQGFKSWLNALDHGRTMGDQARAMAFREDIRKVAGMEKLQISAHVGEHNLLDVLVHDEGAFRASIEDCGTGVQVVVLALSALHRSPGLVVLLDDPEAHLHPAAQTTFAKVLAERARTTGGQVIFATHSPAILDAVPDNQVFEVVREATGVSQVHRLRGRPHVMDSFRDLGYRPSLLRMADAVLLLEGPTDQAAVRAWWKTLYGEEPEPRVALLPIGGDCIRHLERGALAALGRRCFAMLDSDRDSEAAKPKPSAVTFKARMEGIVETHILERRELENYFTAKAVQKAHGFVTAVTFGYFDNVARTVPNFSKGRAGAIAAAMPVRDIPGEIRNLLDDVRLAASAPSVDKLR
ncbi:MAG TPA: AAA family ATPase [Acidimicrobiales bacterium]|nr:AAA family ATPase [Acidimicrobiales bacterium]